MFCFKSLFDKPCYAQRLFSDSIIFTEIVTGTQKKSCHTKGTPIARGLELMNNNSKMTTQDFIKKSRIPEEYKSTYNLFKIYVI